MKDKNYKVLALKYRPKNFSQLIGQEVMVQTIVNSIELNKLPNAYLLTGIRGVGKTTTARLIAKALNCNKNFLNEENCNCNHCEEITNSKHLDVLEMDAASRTGIDDVRELIESSKYNPTSAKYKIFIIDEVHMLSKQAFNGLLKTLEEPPKHLKFIFATTEIKKIPVTIISRCQRFDLHRVPIKVLFNYLSKVAKNENGKISEPAIKLIAKAAEGSVRDSLSLLDRALISQDSSGPEIQEEHIRKMLGIADRSKILELLQFIFQGDQDNSIAHLRKMIDEGIEPKSFLNDLLEIIYFVIQKKNLHKLDSDLSISEAEIENIESISKGVEKSSLIIFWQFILKAMDELSIVNNLNLSLEMLIIRLIHLKGMPTYEGVLEQLNKNENIINNDNLEIKKKISNPTNEKYEISKISKKQIKPTIQTKPKLTLENSNEVLNKISFENISSFEELIKLSSTKKEIELKYDLENHVSLVKFSDGKMDITFNENLSKNFVRNLSKKLLEWTGKRWVITLTKNAGDKTFSEMRFEKKKEMLDLEKKSDIYKDFKEIFSDAELIEVKKNK
tara:strand:- start:1468 stop:3150 length:1683 start_codon:yes stop_codon:yes gene_type:complete